MSRRCVTVLINRPRLLRNDRDSSSITAYTRAHVSVDRPLSASFNTQDTILSTTSLKLDAGQRPTFSPPGCATSRLRPANQLHFLPYANAIYRTSPELSSTDKANKTWLPWQRLLRDRKTNIRLIIYSRGPTNPADLAKIGQVNVEIIGLKGNGFKIRNSSRTYSPPGLLSRED